MKIKRAKRHLSELISMCENWQAESSASVVEDVRTPIGTNVISGRLNSAPLHEEAIAAIGDIVHNLRTSLDAMASSLAELNGQSASKVNFPFAVSEAELENQVKSKSFHRCGGPAVNLLYHFQPWNGGNVSLRALHDLDIADKHNGFVTAPVIAFDALRFELVTDAAGKQTIVPSIPTPNLRLQFGPGTGLSGSDVLPVLEQLVKMVEDILEAFASLEA